MKDAVVNFDFHSITPNELLLDEPPPPGKSYAATIVAAADAVFDAKWVKSSELKASNVHKRDKQVTVSISAKGVMVDRKETKKAESRVGFWDFTHIAQWELNKGRFSFTTCRREGDPPVQAAEPAVSLGAEWVGASMKINAPTADGQTHFAFLGKEAIDMYNKMDAVMNYLMLIQWPGVARGGTDSGSGNGGGGKIALRCPEPQCPLTP
jgi:hypothetical protein